MSNRSADLESNLSLVTERIAAACDAAGRRPEDITLVGVTKTWPAADAALLRDLGVRDLGENRDQEASRKAKEVSGVRWHFIGAVQTNKAASVASYTEVVHSVDRPRLVLALDEGAGRAGRRLDVLLQVSLDGDPARGGAVASDLPALADLVAGSRALRLKGLSAVAPLGADPALAFHRLAELSATLVQEYPAATLISAGMSGDLEAAVEMGATHLRVGTALLGARRAPLR